MRTVRWPILAALIAALCALLVQYGLAAPARASVVPPAGALLAASTSVTLNPSGDTYAHEGNPSTNYYLSSQLRVARATEFLVLCRSYLKFDLSSIPSDAVISSATLSMYLRSASGDPCLLYTSPSPRDS
mgnify:CR=1 FL=1